MAAMARGPATTSDPDGVRAGSARHHRDQDRCSIGVHGFSAGRACGLGWGACERLSTRVLSAWLRAAKLFSVDSVSLQEKGTSRPENFSAWRSTVTPDAVAVSV